MRTSLAFVFEHDESHRLLHLLVTGIVALHYRTRTEKWHRATHVRIQLFGHIFFRSMSIMKQKI